MYFFHIFSYTFIAKCRSECKHIFFGDQRIMNQNKSNKKKDNEIKKNTDKKHTCDEGLSFFHSGSDSYEDIISSSSHNMYKLVQVPTSKKFIQKHTNTLIKHCESLFGKCGDIVKDMLNENPEKDKYPEKIIDDAIQQAKAKLMNQMKEKRKNTKLDDVIFVHS